MKSIQAQLRNTTTSNSKPHDLLKRRAFVLVVVLKNTKPKKQALFCEAFEELGSQKEDIETLGELDYIVAPDNKVIYDFLAVVYCDLSSLLIDKREFESVVLAPFDDFKTSKIY